MENFGGNSFFEPAAKEILLDKFKVSSLLIIPSFDLPLIPMTSNHGLIVDVGYSETRVIPVGLLSLMVADL